MAIDTLMDVTLVVYVFLRQACCTWLCRLMYYFLRLSVMEVLYLSLLLDVLACNCNLNSV